MDAGGVRLEGTSLQRRVVQTIGSSAVELTSLIPGRSVRVTSATHSEAELEDTVRALRNPGSAAGRASRRRRGRQINNHLRTKIGGRAGKQPRRQYCISCE